MAEHRRCVSVYRPGTRGTGSYVMVVSSSGHCVITIANRREWEMQQWRAHLAQVALWVVGLLMVKVGKGSNHKAEAHHRHVCNWDAETHHRHHSPVQGYTKPPQMEHAQRDRPKYRISMSPECKEESFCRLMLKMSTGINAMHDTWGKENHQDTRKVHPSHTHTQTHTHIYIYTYTHTHTSPVQ